MSNETRIAAVRSAASFLQNALENHPVLGSLSPKDLIFACYLSIQEDEDAKSLIRLDDDR